MFLFRWGKKDPSEKENLVSYKLQAAPKEPLIKWRQKDQTEKNANKEKRAPIKFKAPQNLKNKKKKNSFFSLAGFNFFGKSKRKRTPKAAKRNSKKEESPQRTEVKSIIKKFEFSKGEERRTSKGTINVGKAKLSTQTSATKVNPRRNSVHIDPIANEELLEVLTEEERKSIEVVTLIDGSSNGDNSGTDRDRKDDSGEKDVPAKVKSAYSVKGQNSGTNLRKNKDLLMKTSGLLEESCEIGKKKSYPPKNKHDESDIVTTTKGSTHPEKEIQTKKSILKNIIKMPLSYASRSFKSDVLATKESTKLVKGGNEKRGEKNGETKEDAHKLKNTPDSIHLQNDQDKGDVLSPSDVSDTRSEDTNYSGKMSFNNFIPKFKLPGKKNASPMISSKLKMNRKNSIVGNSFDKADDPQDFKGEELILTCQDIRAKKNNLVGRAKLMEKNLRRRKGEPQEDEAKSIHRKMTKDISEGGPIPFNLQPPLLFTENSFDICPISPIEDIIEIIHSIFNSNKEEAIAKLKMCKENNEKCSSMLKITLDKLNGPQDSVLTNLTKNMSLQRDYLIEVNEVMRAVSED
ncbi:conserved Plasmodium protein, unknown function [Plasmodium knowlesi strain H]|uniref:Uncharacterized protein n=2 Tax=Plasmodium knowlesi TaxID=5850 RepID=B3L2K4_PLAKH|nr:conserved Plasmodium protein, unknown function [Plasmodium knowlesi strain H]OTN67253.1 Uncharacterized protein PKNOH_S06418400 [Plasmodium knowlesi]CAA9987457.1 conserved Plasmodium protein, unknown function [Plasmodium knowlesi strain H]VVS76931.1 conserved Plasmodium protein, unknown function [Plasmodium knowlesi strain H]|eukprot:XP_002258458.1 hypothetical protein, conserved in Plasmodium species [Plasmodium knowlesi strain H]